jgi:flagellar hook protein FlgE
MGFETSLSGLNAASNDLDILGNNIANSNTTGFKVSRGEFQDIFATSSLGVASNAIGQGVSLASVSQLFSQGQFEFTGNSLDLAINGDGFFRLSEQGSISYSRAGSFKLNRDGNIVTAGNKVLQGFRAINNRIDFSSPVDLQVNIQNAIPNASTLVTIAANMDAAQEELDPLAFDPLSASTYHHTTSTTLYDSLGNSHQMTVYYMKTDNESNTWAAYTSINGEIQQAVDRDGNKSDYFELNFGADGLIHEWQISGAGYYEMEADEGTNTSGATIDLSDPPASLPTDPSDPYYTPLDIEFYDDGGVLKYNILNSFTGEPVQGGAGLEAPVPFPVGGFYVFDPDGDGTAISFDPGYDLTIDTASPVAGDTFHVNRNRDATTPSTSTDMITLDFYTPMGADAENLELTLNYSDMTQYGNKFSVNTLTQDGYPSGEFTDLSIDAAGSIFARFTNGQSQLIGQIALATFPSPGNLRPDGATSWSESFASGSAVMSVPGTSGAGTIEAGALEQSNVNMTDQLVKMITAQRNFQANAQMIKTADQVTQTIIQMR